METLRKTFTHRNSLLKSIREQQRYLAYLIQLNNTYRQQLAITELAELWRQLSLANQEVNLLIALELEKLKNRRYVTKNRLLEPDQVTTLVTVAVR